MEVLKFGGASVNSVERIKQLAAILHLNPGGKKVVVISAMGKTTNALEKVTEAFYNNRKEEALELFEHIKKQHLNTAKYLLITSANETDTRLSHLFAEVEWTLHDEPPGILIITTIRWYVLANCFPLLLSVPTLMKREYTINGLM